MQHAMLEIRNSHGFSRTALRDHLGDLSVDGRMEAMVNLYQITRRNYPGDSHFQVTYPSGQKVKRPRFEQHIFRVQVLCLFRCSEMESYRSDT
jgi:hypothetical protein